MSPNTAVRNTYRPLETCIAWVNQPVSKPTMNDLRIRGHSYRNFEPAEMRDFLGYIESGRFKPLLEAVSKFYRALDPDERRRFWKRNPGLMAWVRVYNRAEDLRVWDEYAPGGWKEYETL